jgi:GTPase SAR1 family protein
LDRNRLSSIPAEIGSIRKLRYLSVLENPLTDIPREIGQLSDSTVILLDVSRLPSTMAAAYRAGIPSFLAYLRSLSGARPHYEAKVVFIGDGNAGKTTCLERLITGTFVERPTTHGVEVKHLSVNHPNPKIKGEIYLNCWDFGGQDIYRITHQFFYSPDAIYVLAWNPRDKARRQGIEIWLEGIRLRLGSRARVLIVATHADDDQRAYRIDYDGLKEDFGDIIVDAIEVDSLSGKGFQDLLRLISEEAAHLPHVGDRINTQWLSLKDEILRHKPQISLESYGRIRSSHRIAKDQEEAVLVWLHAIGRVLYFSGDLYLRNFIVTEPEWLTKAMALIAAAVGIGYCGRQ